MLQRSRFAPAHDSWSAGKPGGRTWSRPARAALKHAAALALLAGLVWAMPKLLGPGFFHDQARAAIGLAAAVGEWARAALAAAFQSIPVR